VKLRKDSQDSDSEKKSDNQDPNQYWQGPGKDNKKPSFRPSNNPKNRFALIVFITLAIMFAYMFFDSAAGAKDQVVPYTTFIGYVDANQVMQVEIKEQSLIRFVLKNGISAQTRIPYFDESLLPSLKTKGVSVTGSVQEISFLQIILQLLPWIIFIGFTIMLYRQSSGLNGKMMSTLGKSRAKEYMDTDTKTTFKDVAGQVEAKYELEEVVAFLKHPDRFTKVGAKIPRGVLLVVVPTLSKCLSVWVRRVSEIYSSRPASTLPVFCLSMSWMLSGAPAAVGLAVETMNVNRRSTRFSSRWTDFPPQSALLSWRRPTVLMYWILHCSDPDVSTDRL
jgi:cell division protease FtsH